MDPALLAKKLEFEQVKARAKALRLRLTCVICGEKAQLNCPCETTQYCTVACQKIDWRERGHRAACKKIRNDRAAEAARAEAPTPPPPPEVVFYGPAPRSHADEVRARIAAEHEAARARREAEPERKPTPRGSTRCPICLEDWDVNEGSVFRPCCCRSVCPKCTLKIGNDPCPLCRANVTAWSAAEHLASIRRHVENDVPEAISYLGTAYRDGAYGLVKSMKKAVKIWKRAMELGNVDALVHLGVAYNNGDGGIKMDKKKAQQFYRAAADRGNAEAQCNLGRMLCKQYNIEEGISLLRQSAAQGHTAAEECLGGWFVLSDDTRMEGIRFLNRAAAKGNDRARTTLAELGETPR